MTSKQLLSQWIEAGDVGISYAFDVTIATPTRIEPPDPVDFDKPDSPATKAFSESFFGDRLGVRLGPIVFSHSYKKKRDRVNFNNRRNVFDLRETAGKLILMPGEGLTVNSIENIALGSSTAAIVIPRLSLATAGIVTATTYIDPYWQGILQLYIKNTTESAYELKIGERIAVCRFYSILGEPEPEEAQRHFADKSHHFGLNWTKILDTDTDPHPFRKMPTPMVWRGRAKLFGQSAVKVWGVLIGGSLVTVITGWVITYGKLTERLERFAKLEETLSKVQESATRSADDLKTLRTKQVSMGVAELVIARGATSALVEIPLERPWSRSDVLWVEMVEPDPSTRLKHTIIMNSALPERELLRIEAERSAPETSASRIAVRWLVGSQ